ncbi:MAG: transporter substrate-binding domain-containing protein [Alteromonadaceae bacterium]|nr:transporter substrate-binding domain-containing protein [Alteromonadaceae bacterium]
MRTIKFWNGNKSQIRGRYEPEIISAVLQATAADYGAYSLEVDNTDYPVALDESDIFINGTDVIVTVAGNEKFANRDKIVVPIALDKGLLGYRALLCCKPNAAKFSSVTSLTELREHKVGVPSTWVDAELFRHNGLSVVEEGSLDDHFERLQRDRFDFSSLGMNEVEAILEQFSASECSVVIVPDVMLYCPLILVFYVHPEQQELAERIKAGLDKIASNGEWSRLYDAYYGDIITGLSLSTRRTIHLLCPDQAPWMKAFQPTVLA